MAGGSGQKAEVEAHIIVKETKSSCHYKVSKQQITGLSRVTISISRKKQGYSNSHSDIYWGVLTREIRGCTKAIVLVKI